jgi:hypothetical protein
MSNAFLLFRSLLIYGICLPLAILLGYMLSDPLSLVSVGTVAVIFALLSLPLFLKWHYPWLFACWNLSAVAFLLPGRPDFATLMCGISLLISILQYTLNKQNKFIIVPSLIRPLVFILVVVIATAKLTGGFGMAITGSTNMGGRRYLMIFTAVIGFFALTARRIPPNRVTLYFCLFFLGGVSAAISNLASVVAPGLYFLFLIFPTDSSGVAALTDSNSVVGVHSLYSRLGGLSMACTAVFCVMLALYGIRGLFDLRKYWRLPLFLLVVMLGMFGGYRSAAITFIAIFALVFYFEGLMRSRLMPIFAVAFIFTAALSLPFFDHFPLSVQRSLAFVPGLKLDPVAEMDAKGSTEWRLQMWKNVVPEIPRYLILGKGLSINQAELATVNNIGAAVGEVGEGQVLSGDYHSGPLSLIITFGIPGVITFFWFVFAGVRALYHNYKFGDEAHKRLNTFLLAYFLCKVLIFFTIFGSFYSDLTLFAGLLGLSVAINGGVKSPVAVPVPKKPVFNKFKLAPATH